MTAVVPRPRRSAGAALADCAAWGAALGLLVGVVIGTASWPIVGAFFGGMSGAVAGGVLGVVAGPLVRRHRERGTALPLLARCLVLACVGGTGIGGIVGLGIGLHTSPATAVFAVVEAAILSAPTAAALGVLAALAILAWRHVRR